MIERKTDQSSSVRKVRRRGNFPENWQHGHLCKLSDMFLQNSGAKHIALATGVFRSVPELRAAKKIPVV
jgi:hypothetical protein